MNRPLTALFAALEALLVVGIGIGIPLVPLTIMWAAQYGLQVDWGVFWRASVDIWLLGSGADVMVTLDPTLATTAGFVGAATPFAITIAPLGFALLTLLFGVRAGRRVAETPYRIIGAVVSIGTFAVLALTAAASALYPLARPSLSQGTLLPTLVFGVGVTIGSEITRRRLRAARPDILVREGTVREGTVREGTVREGTVREGTVRAGTVRAGGQPRPTVLERALSVRREAWRLVGGDRLRDWVQDWPPRVRTTVAAGLRGGTMAAATVVAASSILFAVMLVLGYGRVIGLYESVHTGVLGGIALTIGQLAFVPNFVIWAMSWLIGPGFAIGTGSAVSPLGTNLGPIPAVPVLGALPHDDLAFGFLGLLVPVLTGFLIGVLIRSRLEPGPLSREELGWLSATGAAVGVVGGVLLGLLAWSSAGAAGPGRLVQVGPDPWLVGTYAALEIGLAAAAGLLASRSRTPDPGARSR